jgi:hypothetical protein
MSSSNIQKFVEKIVDVYENCDREILLNLWKDINNNTEQGCVFKITRGEKRGEKCGKKTKGGEYCFRHEKSVFKKSDVDEKKEKKITKPRECKRSISPVRKELGTRVLRKHPILDVLYHNETNLVFRSARNRSVIGVIRDDKVCDLNEDDVEIAKKWSFAIEDIVGDTIDDANKNMLSSDSYHPCESRPLNKQLNKALKETDKINEIKSLPKEFDKR